MMHDSKYSDEYLDRYIYRDLSDSELEEIRNKIMDDPGLSERVGLREIEIIERYLKGELEGRQMKKIELRIQADKKFEENVSFSRNLDFTAKEIKRRKKLEHQLGEIKRKIDHEIESGTYVPLTIDENQDNEETDTNSMPVSDEANTTDSRPLTGQAVSSKKYIPRNLFIYYSLAIAAAIVLLLVVINPFSDLKKIHRYVANSVELREIEVTSIPLYSHGQRTADTAISHQISGIQKISVIDNERLKDKYFIKDKVLYSYFDSQAEFKVFARVDIEGQAEYYLCIDKTIYRYLDNIESKIFEFEHVTDTSMLKFCQ